MLHVTYLAHGGQMTGDEMAIVGIGLAGALIIPMAAVAYIFLNKRTVADGAIPSEPDAPLATHETIGSAEQSWERT